MRPGESFPCDHRHGRRISVTRAKVLSKDEEPWQWFRVLNQQGELAPWRAVV